MPAKLRKVRTASGATAVQIVIKRHGRVKVLEHLGSAHNEAELAVLWEVGRRKLHEGQLELDLGLDTTPDVGPHVGPPSGSGTMAVVNEKVSGLLIDVVRGAWEALGFTVVKDEAFFQLVLARLVEPTSMSDSGRVVSELGVTPFHRNTYGAALKKCGQHDYRHQIATACYEYAASGSSLSLLLYDVTTLYFEADKEDEVTGPHEGLRKVGYSKERRVDPQIVVGLLVDRSGFPLEIQAFEGNKAETQTLIPVIQAFRARHHIADMVVVADAGMLSVSNLEALEAAGLRFIVGSRLTKAPADLERHFLWNSGEPDDGDIVDTLTMRRGRPDPSRTRSTSEPVWNPDNPDHEACWRAVWHYRYKRALRDRKTLSLQRERAEKIIAGDKPVTSTRFVATTGTTRAFDQASFDRAERLAGWKGYITNIPHTLMPSFEVISSYHDLWHVEQSFRMSKTDLRARPIFHHTRDAIEAHLTIVFTALAINRYLYQATGLTLPTIVRALKPLQEITITLAGHHITAQPQLTPQATMILTNLRDHKGH